MADFEAALSAFAQGELDLEGLGETLDQTLAQAPEQAPALLARIEDLYRSGRLPVPVYQSLTQRIQQAPGGGAAANESPPGAAGDDPTEHTAPPAASEGTGDEDGETVVRPAGARATPPASQPEPAAEDDAETVHSQAVGSEWVPPPDWDDASSEPVGQGAVLKNRFVLEQVIAAGGMGVVYKARDLRKEEAQDRDPYVAIKVLGEDFRKHPDSFRALQREAKKAQRLAHPNIVTVYDFDRDGATVFMTMEHLRGESLEHIIKRARPRGLPKDEVLPLIEGMAQGLAYAHDQGIVHSDLKPGNVFVTEAGTVKLLDFGIARAAKRPGQAQETTLFDAGNLGALTPAYASCEMLEDQDPDPRDDIYALACMTYELLAGQHPFNKLPAVHARDGNLQAAPIKALSRTQWKGLQQGLAFDREQRTSDARTFLDQLNDTAGAVVVTRRWGIGVGLGSLAVIGAAVGGVLMFMPGPGPSEPTCSAPPAPAQPLGALDAATQTKVERLLTVAEAHLMVGRLTDPPGSNAYAAYQQVMELHPNDAKAWAGYRRVADSLAKQAQGHIESGNFNKGLDVVNQGLEVCSQHEGLLALKQRIDEVLN